MTEMFEFSHSKAQDQNHKDLKAASNPGYFKI
jgi:hypothetical protein